MKKSIKQSTLTAILNITSLLLLLLSCMAFFFIIKYTNAANDAYDNRYNLTANAKRFMEGSAYLTDEVRAYAATEDSIHYDNYWNEVNVVKNRDIAVANMRKIGITQAEEKLVEKMFSLSNNLIPLEEKSMVLAAEGKRKEALDAVYSEGYENWISRIRQAQTEFIATLGVRTESEVTSLLTLSRWWTAITVACLAVTAAIQIISALALHTRVIRPIVAIRDEMLQIARGNLHSGFNAVPDTSEIGMLIGSIQSTKSELNKYIGDISEKLAAIAAGNLQTRVVIDYIGDFAEIKTAINEITRILSEQREQDKNSREKLREAYKAANDANQAKSSFLSTMSHEIRTPMNAVIGMTNIALTSTEAARKDYCLEKIADASVHLLGVINDVLDMSKIDANKFELASAECNVEKMLLKIVNFITFRMDEKRQKLRVVIDDALPRTIITDEQRLSQVITNLLTNAAKFTPEDGSIHLSARLEEKTDNDCVLCISVQDTGIGISEEQQKKLFTSFTQADADISRRFGGTGLGLAISKSIVEKMNGRIWIESREGQGATFSFTMRAGLGSENQADSPADPAVAWEKLRVLVVDDEPEVRECFQHIAERLGFHCDAVPGGPEACEKITSQAPHDIYFIDWSLPGMNGVELIRRIRELGCGNAAFIMSSATEWVMIEKEAREAGIADFIPKPLFPSVVTDAMAQCLGVGACLPGGKQDGGQPDFSGRRILLVEDVAINREIVLSLLEPTGLAITCSENGSSAVAAMETRARDFDMIFMDVHMPEMDGYEATRRIRAMEDEHARTIPIIAMTANVFREDIEKCLSAGMNGHVGKPLNLGKVLEQLTAHLPG
ncbi:putative Histidine kinase [uncultured delta proteobacterium]|uniref:histidine kinase n=1 Tax=uncultured delta proteobacterium TaxID=34034 RepID=A0A212IX53_9DELT|nr:putative Histidine kinase [uncultured delta proteobacterium]